MCRARPYHEIQVCFAGCVEAHNTSRTRRGSGFIYQVWPFLLLASMGWQKLLSPMLCTGLPSYKGQWCRTGQISQVPWENEAKLKFKLNWWPLQLTMCRMNISITVFPNTPSPLIFQLQLALASSLRIHLPLPGLHFFHVSASSRLLFYCLVSFRKNSCFHTINQVLTWFLTVSQSWEQCPLFFFKSIF